MKLLQLLLCLALPIAAQDEPPAGGRGSEDPINQNTFAGLRVRNIGPTSVPGRLAKMALLADSPSHYLIAEASGGVWLTYNDGTTWTPVFDNYGSYSIGTITIDPKNPSVVWLGSG